MNVGLRSSNESASSPSSEHERTPADADERGAARGKAWKWLRRIVGSATALYALSLSVIWLLASFSGVSFWPGMLFYYGPRWILGTPLLVLIPFVMAIVPRFIPLLLISGVILVGPLLGFRVPYRTWYRPTGGPTLKVLTCNVEGDVSDPRAIAQLILNEKPDIVVITESPVDIKTKYGLQGGWYMRHEKSDVSIASRYPIIDFKVIEGDQSIRSGCAAMAKIQTPEEQITVVGVHLPTPRWALEAAIHHNRDTPALIRETWTRLWHESDVVSRWIKDNSAQSNPLMILGDFNLTVETPVYSDFWSEYGNSFDESGLGFGPTKFTKYFSARIDHILHNDRYRAARSWIGPDVGSDHAPILAELEYLETPQPNK